MKDTTLVPLALSFESLKKLNTHGVEYWSARDLQTCLGYSEWRKFEFTLKKGMQSCSESGNDPTHHFVGADKMVRGVVAKIDKKVRSTIEEIGGALPENIPPAEPITNVEKRVKRSHISSFTGKLANKR